MARPENNQTWGTWDELLLACAVHRHGTHNWDSIAGELRKRTSSLRLPTPLACQHKFKELQRRFAKHDTVLDSAVPWLEELRKLRVAELRREVERYDLSIVSLQLKVRKLIEEREQSNQQATENSDLERNGEHGGGERQKNGDDEAANKGEKPVSGEESDKENRSINESNSTDPKDNGGGNQPGDAMVESVRSEEKTRRGVVGIGKQPEEDSCDGSCYSVAKKSAEKSERVEVAREAGESVAESKGEGSDMQSSASLSGRKEEGRDQSGGTKRVTLQSQPLVDFLEMLRSHKQGCVFERRLKSQEVPDYGDLIRQHLDFETLQARLEEGYYSVCNMKFFRDLLLLLNNALVFFGNKSKEYRAAVELRKLVSQEMALQTQLSRGCNSVQPAASELPPMPDPQPSHFLAMNAKLSVPSTACRKRSSLATKAFKTLLPESKKLQQPGLLDEKPIIDSKTQDQSSGKSEENRVSNEKSTPGARKAKKNTKGRSNPDKDENPDKSSGVSSTEKLGPEDNQKEKNDISNSKRRNAANFLNRIKRGSLPNKGLVTEETVKGSADASDKAKSDKSEQNNNTNVKSDARKEGNLRMRAGGRNAKEHRNEAKQNRRPPTQPPQPQPVSGKRRRGASETEAGSSGNATKRSRK